MEVAIVTLAAKVAAYTIRPIGRHIVRPMARRLCPLKNLWEYETNLGNLKAEVKEVEAKRVSVRGLTIAGVEPLPEVNDWLEKASNLINEVSTLITEDNPEQQETGCCQGCTYSNLKGCCRRCTYSNLKEWYQNRNTVARKLKNVTRLLQEATKSMSLWMSNSNLENLKKEVTDLESQRETVKLLIKDGEEPLPHVKTWQRSVESIINNVPGLINPQQQNMQCCHGRICSDLNICSQCGENVVQKLTDVAELLQQAREFGNIVSTMSEETKYKINLENLKKEVEKLRAKRERVKCLINVGEEPLPDVRLWQDKTNNIINEVLGISSRQRNSLAQMLNHVAQLLQEFNEFKKFSFRPIPEEPWIYSSKGYEAFKSRTSILKDIIEALSKPDVGLVGIYGMGGIGKTMLAKQVARQSFEDKLFDKIVFVEVSQTPDIKKLQGEIGSKLGLKFHEEDDSYERARQLYQQLKSEAKTLLILDNIWESLNFETVGIPYKHDSKGLKLLMTARREEVLTDGMEYSQHNFRIDALEWEDAWSLFKSKAGTCVDRHDLLLVAVDVAKECGGVPIAIVTIAKALNNKETCVWKKVLRELRNPSPYSLDGIAANVYRSIELSYNYLETEELKATFLLCGSMGSTYDTSIEDLLRYGIGLGLFNRFNTIEEEWDNVCSLVNTLKASSLLVDAPEGGKDDPIRLPNIERIAMHDIVCGVARSIADKHKNVKNVIDNVIPRSWESENMLSNCISITLHNVDKLSKSLQLVCPQLKFLYVKPKLSYPNKLRIPDKFFAWMPKLQVLHLIKMNLEPLATSFSNLVNLKTFCLKGCLLKEIADIGDLKNLEILSICGGIVLYSKLHEKIHQLTKLRLLELNDCVTDCIPLGFILSFKKLEAFYSSHCIKWEVDKSENGSRNASLDVLEHLSNLTSLEIRVENSTMLRDLLSPKLERYNIRIGVTWSTPEKPNHWEIRCKTSRFLEVNVNGDGIISRLKPIRQLVLHEVSGIPSNFCALDKMGFPELEDLQVQNNPHILHVVDRASYDGVFPILKSLILWNLINLKTVCNGPLGLQLFHQLRTIKVGKCNELTNIFSFINDRVFQKLEEIEVLDCNNVEEIFAISEQVHEVKLSKLRILRLISLPQLESICCNVKTATQILQLTNHTKPGDLRPEEEQEDSKPFFNEKVVMMDLETLEIGDINVKTIWDNQIPTVSSIQNLTCLFISNLTNLRRLGSKDYIKFPLLKEMTIRSCPNFREFFFDDKVGVPSLERINIFKMNNLEMIWHEQLTQDSCPKLKSLQVEECQKLLTLFGSNMCGRFLSLETLHVSKCGSLEKILDLQGINSEESHPTTSTQSGELFTYSPLVLFFANLRNLEVSECQNLKTIVSKGEVEAKEAPVTARFVFPKLTSLELQELPALTTFYPGRYTTEWPVLKSFIMCQSGTHDIDEKSAMRQLSLLPSQVAFAFQVGKFWPNLLLTMFSWVQNLTVLILYDCGNLEELFSDSTMVTEHLREKKTENTILFPNLNYLEMERLPNLKGLCSGCCIEFRTLIQFSISNCPKLTAFIFDDKIRVPSLQCINISFMDNLEMIWHNQLVEDSIPKLKSLQVEGCDKLLSLFGLTVYGRFLSLETLHVSDCGSLEEIFNLHKINSEERQSMISTQSKELYTTVLSFENLQNLIVSQCESLKNLFSISDVAKERVVMKKAHATTKFVFPKLISLALYKLPEFRTFYPDRYTVEWPILKRLQLWICGIPGIEDEEQMQHPLILVEKAFPRLEKLMLAGKDLMMILQGQDRPEHLFRNFKILQVLDESNEDYLSGADQPVLHYIGHVKYMWKQNFILDLILSNFKKIRVDDSDSFISQMPPSASFQCLTSLEVCDCNSLEHIGTFSMAKNLVKLVHLKIRGCRNIVEVLGNHGDVTGDKILFSKLKSLSLENLPSLRSFCSRNFTLEFPSLKELIVFTCPNMKIFSQGDLITPKLHIVKNYLRSVELYGDVDVSIAIQRIHERERNLRPRRLE